MTGEILPFECSGQTLARMLPRQTTKNKAPERESHGWRVHNGKRNDTPGTRAVSQEWQNTHRGTQTHDHKGKGLVLCRLSKAGHVTALWQAQTLRAPGELQRRSKTKAPWEAGTPDLEVNSLTL